MATTVTTHSSCVRASRISTLSSLATSVDSCSMSPKTCMSLPSSPISMSGMSLPSSPISMSGLLNSRNLVQDEKLVVATLATLNSGSASNLIKQDLKWIIQSRRKAEGKTELQVEFKKPVKDQLTSEELVKRRRRELNRLAARRSREKGQKRKDMLVEEIRKLQSQNCELVNVLGDLTEQRNSIVGTLRQHMKQCSDYHATQNAAVGMSQRVLDLLGFPSLSANETQVQGVSDLYICTGDSSSSHSRSQSPSLIVKQEQYSFSSCPLSPLVLGKLVKVKHKPVSRAMLVCDDDDDDSIVNPKFSNLPNPQVSYYIPPSSPEFESPLLPSAVARLPLRRSSTQGSDMSTVTTRLPLRRSSTQGSDMSTVTTSSTADIAAAADEEEVSHYKHKLMKHRKQFSDIIDSSSTGSRGFRLCLERSFSFPSTIRQSRSCLDSVSSGSYMMDLTQSDISNIDLTHTPTTIALDSCSEGGETVSSSLDLVVNRSGHLLSESSGEKQFISSQMDTWPPAGMRVSVLSRNIERRWSVDDHQPQPLLEPLNLSSKNNMEEGYILSETNTSTSHSETNTSTSHSENQYSDPYR